MTAVWRNGVVCNRVASNGQATVELALAMPLLCLMLLGAVQIVQVVSDQIAVIEAARVGARAAAVSADPEAAADTATRHVIREPMRVSTRVDNGYVTVAVTLTNATDVPLIGVLLPDIELVSRATMILEPP